MICWIFLLISVAIVTQGAPVDDERYTTTSRYYLPTTTPSTTTTNRRYLPTVTVKPPRPGVYGSGSKSDSANGYPNKNNKRPEFENDNRLPHLPPEIDEWEKWQKMNEEEKKEAWDKWSKIDSWYNKPPTILSDDNDFTYWWFKLPYLYCPPYIRKY